MRKRTRQPDPRSERLSVDRVTRPSLNGIALPKPLLLRWCEQHEPLPLRKIQAPPRRAGLLSLFQPSPQHLPTGPLDAPFDFTGHMRRLCEDVTRRCPELAHINPERLLFAVTQARTGRKHGLQASVTPLRFRGGNLTRQRRGVTFQVQRYFLGDHEFLYLVTFCLPRFLDTGFDEKFITLFHELYHIGERFDGDLRRHEGRYAFHSHSKRDYDHHMAHLARIYLDQKPDPTLHAFLRLDFEQLQRRHGSVVGVMVPRPKVIPLLEPRA